jgi:hypothetical protein
MELAAYLGTVTATVTLALGSMWVVATVLGRRIDDMGASLGARIARVESQNDAILGAVTDLGHRVARLEARGS